MMQLTSSAIALLLKQRTRYAAFDRADIERELTADIRQFASTVGPLLPPIAGRGRFIDIGCGLGFGLLGLRAIFGPDHQFVGIDRSTASAEINYGFSEEPSSYNDLAVTREMLRGAGIVDRHIEMIDIDSQPFPEGEADVVMSALAWGFHFPVDVYLARVNKVLKSGGSLIIDLRRGAGQEDALEPYYTPLGLVRGAKHDRHVLRRK